MHNIRTAVSNYMQQNGKIPAPSSLKGMSQPACSSTPKVVRGVNKQCRSLPSASLKNKVSYVSSINWDSSLNHCHDIVLVGVYRI